MAQVLATRMAFGQELLEIARRNQNFVVCNADTKTCGLEKFGKEFPGNSLSESRNKILWRARLGWPPAGTRCFWPPLQSSPR